MYKLINDHIEDILISITDNHVKDYDWLSDNIEQVSTPEYQRIYKNYWRLNAARLSQRYCQSYFYRLQSCLNNGAPLLKDLVLRLYKIPSHKYERKTLQFSFCTKLCHMLNPHLPIYDRMIRDFYFFSEPSRNGDTISKRVNAYINFYDFLDKEYDRVLGKKLLAPAIRSFRDRFNPRFFTDEKIIDSLIWASIGFLKEGALVEKTVCFH